MTLALKHSYILTILQMFTNSALVNVPRSDQESLLDDKRLTLVRGNSDNGDEAILLPLEGGTSPKHSDCLIPTFVMQPVTLHNNTPLSPICYVCRLTVLGMDRACLAHGLQKQQLWICRELNGEIPPHPRSKCYAHS